MSGDTARPGTAQVSAHWLAVLFAVTFVLNFATAAAWSLFTAFGARDVPEYILALKDVSILGGMLLVMFAVLAQGYVLVNRRAASVLLLVLCILFANAVGFVASPAGLGAKVLNLRRNILLPSVMLALALLPLSSRQIESFLRFAISIALILALFGFFEYSMPDYFWDRVMNINEYQRSIELDPFPSVVIATSGRFYSWDLVGLTGHTVRRMASLYFEPTTLASFFAFALIALIFAGLRFRGRWIAIAIVLGAGLLALSKAFIVGLGIIAWFKLFPRLRPWLFLAAIGGVFGISALIVSLGLPGGYFAHLQGFYRGVLFLFEHPLGSGLGVGGNYADVAASASIDLEAGAESGLGNLLVQLGAFAILYVIAVYSTLRTLKHEFERSGNPLFRAAFIGFLFWSLTLMMSASSLGASGNVFYFMLTGLLLSVAHADPRQVLKIRLRDEQELA